MWIDRRGYVWISVEGKEVLEHRYVMEQFLGRKLTTDETVHHKDENKAHNNISNLEVKTRSKHQSDHRTHHPPCRVCGALTIRKDGRGHQGAKGLCAKHYQQLRAGKLHVQM